MLTAIADTSNTCCSCPSSTPTHLTVSAPPLPATQCAFSTLTTATTFRPSQQTTEGILTALSDPDATLRDIATHFETTLEALTAWLDRADIAARVNNLRSAIAARTHLLAATFLAQAPRALDRIINAYIDEEAHIPVRPTCVEDRDQRRRSRETAIKAIRLLKQLATPSLMKKAVEPQGTGQRQPAATPEALINSPVPRTAPEPTRIAPELHCPAPAPSGTLAAPRSPACASPSSSP